MSTASTGTAFRTRGWGGAVPDHPIHPYSEGAPVSSLIWLGVAQNRRLLLADGMCLTANDSCRMHERRAVYATSGAFLPP